MSNDYACDVCGYDKSGTVSDHGRYAASRWQTEAWKFSVHTDLSSVTGDQLVLKVDLLSVLAGHVAELEGLYAALLSSGDRR